MVAGVPVEDHEKLANEVKCLHETLGKTQSMLDAMQARLQALERGLTRSEAQVDLLIRLQQSGHRPLRRRKCLQVHMGWIPIRLK